MVNLFNSWAQIVEFVQHFSIFMFGYAYKAIMKTLGLLGVFIAGNWLWNHSAVITQIIAAGTGEG